MDRDGGEGVHGQVGDGEDGEWTKERYAKYLLTPHWKAMAKRKLDSVGHRCELCYGRYELHVHHLHYNSLWHEKLSDLQVLCRQCHEDEEDIRGER